MRIEKGALIREDPNTDFNGARGDSCFDSSAFALSWLRTRGEYHTELNLDQFVTDEGTIRHPECKWRGGDTTTDQELPLYMFMRETCNTQLAALIKERTVARGWKTGNGDFVSAGYFAELKGWQWLRCVCLVMQVLFFWFPVYWNDGKWGKREWPVGLSWYKSDGYLQWALIAVLAPYPFRKLIRKSTLKKKIADYYAPEGESGAWVVATHHAMIERFF